VLDLPIERPAFIETTALGAAMLAGVGCGLFRDLEEAAAMRGEAARFLPNLGHKERVRRLDGWSRALASALAG
jgi:glycerol kinase